MFTLVYSSLPSFTRVYLLTMFTLVYVCLLVFTSFLPQFTRACFLRLPRYIDVYIFLHLFTYV